MSSLRQQAASSHAAQPPSVTELLDEQTRVIDLAERLADSAQATGNRHLGRAAAHIFYTAHDIQAAAEALAVSA